MGTLKWWRRSEWNMIQKTQIFSKLSILNAESLIYNHYSLELCLPEESSDLVGFDISRMHNVTLWDLGFNYWNSWPLCKKTTRWYQKTQAAESRIWGALTNHPTAGKICLEKIQNACWFEALDLKHSWLCSEVNDLHSFLIHQAHPKGGTRIAWH